MTAPVSAAVIRQWARDNGLDVGERGRLAPKVLSAYANSMSSSSAAFDQALAVTPAQPSRMQVPRAVRIPVQPAPGANGIGHRVKARNR